MNIETSLWKRVFVVWLLTLGNRSVAAEQDVIESTRVSYVLEPFEHVNEQWITKQENVIVPIMDGNSTNGASGLNAFTVLATEGTHSHGKASARVAWYPHHGQVSLGWFLEAFNIGTYNCYSADRLSLWVQRPPLPTSKANGEDTPIVQVSLSLWEDTNCVDPMLATNCTRHDFTEHLVLQRTIAESALDEWTELSVSLLDLQTFSFPLNRIRGWQISLLAIVADEEIKDISNETAFSSAPPPIVVHLDHLACYGPGSLLGAPFYEGDSLKTSGTWYDTYFQSQASFDFTVRSLTNGVLRSDYTVEQVETWGGFIDYTHRVPAASYYNLSGSNHFHIKYTTHQKASTPDRAIFRLVLQDGSECFGKSCGDDEYERYWSFHDILDQETDDGTITIPFVASPQPYTPFWLTGWSGIIGNSELDLEMIKGYKLELVLDSFLALGQTVSGSVSFTDVEAVVAPIQQADTSRCVVEPGVVVPETSLGWTRLEFLGFICCTVCDTDPNCVFSFSTGRDCYTSSRLEPGVVELQGNAVESFETVFMWMDDSVKRGAFCQMCDCYPDQELIDCRGKNLTIIPKDFDNTTWTPATLDLRENPSLTLLGSGSLTSVQNSLRHLKLPVGLKHIGFATFLELNLVSFEVEKEHAVGDTLFNNAISQPTDAFADVCCSLGDSVAVDDRHFQFCDMQPETPGIDCVFLDFIYYPVADLLSFISPSSPFMSEAAESKEKCAEYCAVSSGCNYFSYDARFPNAEHYCQLLSHPGPESIEVCCDADHYADLNMTIPGWTSGMPPRTRHTMLNAKTLIGPTRLVMNTSNDFQVIFRIQLGSMPLRGAIWVEPQVDEDRDYELLITPSRVVLYDNATTAEVTVTAPSVPAGSGGGTLVIRNKISSCDKAFAESASSENTVFIDVVAPQLLSEDPIDLRVIIITLSLAALLILVLGVLVYERLIKKDDSVWKVDVKELKFHEPPEIVGRGSFGFVLLAEFRGTKVAVKRVIPPDTKKKSKRVSGRKNGLTRSLSANFMSDRSDRSSSDDDDTSGVDLSESDVSSWGCLSDGLSGSEASEIVANGKLAQKGPSKGMLSRGMDSSAGRSSAGMGSMGRLGSVATRQRVYKQLRREFKEEMRYLSKLRHPNVTTVMGAVIDKGVEPMLIMEYMEHGSLYDLLHNETMVIESDIILPVLSDIVAGMRFLHAADPPVIHGDLKAANILVDNKFRAKVADFGLSQKKQIGGTGTPFWMAPELLRRQSQNTPMSDIYSFGIIVYEAFSRKDPYEGERVDHVLRLVADSRISKRPPFPKGCPPQVQSIMADCIVDNPTMRPTATELATRLQRVEVEDSDIRDKSAVSLFDIFPRHIAEALRAGRPVEAEHKDCVTIFFSDIVGFTNISSTLEPRKVAMMLDRLYHAFDELSLKHDIFKVETIGDAYMAVTNLVKDQSDDHAKRIAEFAIDAIHAANLTLIDEDDRSKGYVNIRVGFHSGPVVADVVGNRNPRYCLFGDTVNTASRMESNSKVNRIHCSERAAELLEQQAPSIDIRSRGSISIKGKGEMVTFWVNEKPRISSEPSGRDLLNWVAGKKSMGKIAEERSEDLRLSVKSTEAGHPETIRMEPNIVEAIPEMEAHPKSIQNLPNGSVTTTSPDVDYGAAEPNREFIEVRNRLKDRLSRNTASSSSDLEEERSLASVSRSSG